jgi:hypothetical protein
LHDGDDETSVNDELSELRRTTIGIAAMPHEQFRQKAELRDRKIGGQGCLFAFLSYDANTYSHIDCMNIVHIYVLLKKELTDISCLNHTDIVTTVSYTTYSLLGMFSDKSGYICFLCWRATTSNDSR